MQFGLGRQIAQDPRDRSFHMMSMVDQAAQAQDMNERVIRYHYSSGFWGDQGSAPACVGFACAHLMEDGPVTQPASKVGTALLDPMQIYKDAQRIDEWPGENYDGTSIRAGLKILQRHGIITEYRWAWDLETVVEALRFTGPVLVGTWWYYDMFWPNAAGFLSVGGTPVGGHAYLLNGVNLKTRTVRIKNSWGREWGKKGHAYMTFDNLRRLIREDGEAAIVKEVAVATVQRTLQAAAQEQQQ